jgi:hypothetical protein
MNPTSKAEFLAEMMRLARPAQEFRPTATYDADGDCIEFLIKPDPFLAERVDELVTVYYSQETGEVIGSLIKGVSRFYRKLLGTMPGFRIEIECGPIRLVHIFRAKVWSSTEDPRGATALIYRKLIDAAEHAEVEVEGELCLA